MSTREALLLSGLAVTLASCTGSGTTMLPVAYDPVLLMREAAVEAKIQACGGRFGLAFPAPDSPFVDRAGLEPDWWQARVQAALDADDCDALLAALNGGSAPGTCETVGFSQEMCVNGHWALCEPWKEGHIEFQFEADCFQGEPGGTCTAPVCHGSLLYDCITGHESWEPVVDCTALGLACGEVEDGAACVGTGEPCTPSAHPAKCDGAVLDACVGGKAARIDCAAVTGGHRTCAKGKVDAGGFEAEHRLEPLDDGYSYGPDPGALDWACGPAGTACAEGDASCEGTVARTCLDGSYATFDCATAGFAGCKAGACDGFPK